MRYEPFLIAPFGTGLDTDDEPWMAPADAFTKIRNGHIHHGYLEKRAGYRFLASLVHGQVISAATAADPAVFTPNTVTGLYIGQTVSLHYLEDSGGGQFSGLNAQKYLVRSVDQGAGTFTLTDLDGVNVDTSSGTYTANSGRLGTFSHLVESQTINSATAADPAVFTLASIGTIANGDFVVLRSLSGGTWSTLNAIGGTATNVSGSTLSITQTNGDLVSGSGLGTLTSGTIDKIAPSRVMGLPTYINADNNRELLAGDLERVCVYNGAANLFEPLDLVQSGTSYPNNDHFAGSNTNYLWFTEWQHVGTGPNRVYITNAKQWTTGTPGTDGILYYNATTNGSPAKPAIYQTNPAIGTGSEVLRGAKLLFSLNKRLVALNTFEYNGSTEDNYPQRARWSTVFNPDDWDSTTPGKGGFVDAATGEQIISARIVQDVLIVNFTNSVWSLTPTPDPARPFKWARINNFRACDGRMASVGYDRYSIAMGIRGITATDGVETRRVDQRIEDFVSDEINDDEFDKVFGERSYEATRTWFLYPTEAADDANSALIYDDDSSAFSIYDINMNVLGHGGVPIDYAAQDFTSANSLDISAQDLDDETASSFFFSEKAEIFIGGDRQGKVHVLETGLTDAGTGISFSLQSAAWNPYKEQGGESQMGYVDFYVDTDQTTVFTVEFYKNDNENPYETQTVDCLPNLNFRSGVSNISINSDPSTGFAVTSQAHGLASGDLFYIYGVINAGQFNNTQWQVGATVGDNSFTVDTDITNLGQAITGISQANPAVVTSANHGFSDGDLIYVVDVTGMTEVNDLEFTVANSTTNTFELQGIDSSAYTAYSSGGYAFYQYQGGGKIVERAFYRTKCWKRAYAGGIGYQHRIGITNLQNGQPLQIYAFKPWFGVRGRRILG